MKHAPSLPPAYAEWVLIADATRARVLSRDAVGGTLHELAAFTHPASRLAARTLSSDRAGHALKSNGASTALQAHTSPHQKQVVRFARELRDFVDEAAQARRFDRIALLAPSGMLGELRAQLSEFTAHRVHASVPVDLAAYGGPELEHRVTAALAAAREAHPAA